jgi:3(or 17)beta-hydroxysteroid dehydrogenase
MTQPTHRFASRVALVTGAASGIGREVARQLAAEGAAVCCADLNAAGAEETARAIESAGHVATARGLDVSDEAAWESVIQHVLASRGRLDMLVNSAGVSSASPVAALAYAEWRRVFAINVDGVFLGTKHAIQAMGSSGGSIVNVGSASGIKAAAGASAYSASKAAVCMFSKTVAKECRDQGIPIRVNTVCPGGVKTPMWTTMPFFRELVAKAGSEEAAYQSLAAGTPGGQFAEPADIARAILFLASDDACFITGIDLVIDGGYVL